MSPTQIFLRWDKKLFLRLYVNIVMAHTCKNLSNLATKKFHNNSAPIFPAATNNTTNHITKHQQNSNSTCYLQSVRYSFLQHNIEYPSCLSPRIFCRPMIFRNIIPDDSHKHQDNSLHEQITEHFSQIIPIEKGKIRHLPNCIVHVCIFFLTNLPYQLQ